MVFLVGLERSFNMLDKNMLETSKKNAILINYSEDENKEKLPKGTSKIGG